MELQLALECHRLCSNAPQIQEYAEGCDALEAEIQTNPELVIAHQGVAKCQGFRLGLGDSLNRRTCTAKVIAPHIRPTSPKVVEGTHGVEATTTVSVTPPPLLPTRVTVSPVQ